MIAYKIGMEMINKGRGRFELWFGAKPRRIREKRPSFIIYNGEKIILKYPKRK
jgi:hypothetical protein